MVERSERSISSIVIDCGVTLHVRTYREEDRAQVRRLYRDGLLIGSPDDGDAAPDLDEIEDVYLKRPHDHFWVAQVDGAVIGCVGILKDDSQIAHVRRLRVDPAWETWHDGEISRVLIRAATEHARWHDCLKLVLYRPEPNGHAVSLLHGLGFEYARTRSQHGRDILEFYLNIYARIERINTGNEHDA
jgi:N-acetylglutamate synthase-like GNAT family acetyltransferase